MNNGRDCPHGRQVDKCDTCDLIKTELELQQVTAERDALAAQVNTLRAAMSSALSQMASWSCGGDELNHALELTEHQCLAAHDAEVAAKAVLEFAAKLLVNQKVDVIDHSKAEADQLRAKAGK